MLNNTPQRVDSGPAPSTPSDNDLCTHASHCSHHSLARGPTAQSPDTAGGLTMAERRGMSKLISGTSSEFLGKKPLPRARFRPLVFVLGPPGVGKSEVAVRLMDGDAVHYTDKEIFNLITLKTRRKKWKPELLDAPRVVIDGPSYLDLRPGCTALLCSLIRERTKMGRRTIITESDDGASINELMDAVLPDERATVILRFPVGRGRVRYALRVCDDLELDRKCAKLVKKLSPWTYDAVHATLLDLKNNGGQNA